MASSSSEFVLVLGDDKQSTVVQADPTEMSEAVWRHSEA